MASFDKLEKIAAEKGYILTKIDHGPQHDTPIPKIWDRHMIWLAGDREGPYREGDPHCKFLSKIGIGPTLEIALKEAQEDIEARSSHASAFYFAEDVRAAFAKWDEVLRSKKIA